MNCRYARPLLETFADGELSPSEMIEVETHLEECARCAEQLSWVQAIKGSVQKVVAEDAQVSEDVLARLQRAMLAEEQQQAELGTQAARSAFEFAQPQRVATSAQGGVGRAWWHKGARTWLPGLAAAAAMVAWLGVKDFAARDVGRAEQRVGSVASASMGMEDTLDRLIDHHSAAPEPLVKEERLLPTFERNVGVRIQLPRLTQYGAQWEGASLVPVTNHQAASLRYSMPGHRVTVYVFDPRKVAVRQPLEKLEPPAAHGTEPVGPVYVGQWRGYSVAAKERRGVGYALAGDLDDAEILRLISSIH